LGAGAGQRDGNNRSSAASRSFISVVADESDGVNRRSDAQWKMTCVVPRIEISVVLRRRRTSISIVTLSRPSAVVPVWGVDATHLVSVRATEYLCDSSSAAIALRASRQRSESSSVGIERCAEHSGAQSWLAHPAKNVNESRISTAASGECVRGVLVEFR